MRRLLGKSIIIALAMTLVCGVSLAPVSADSTPADSPTTSPDNGYVLGLFSHDFGAGFFSIAPPSEAAYAQNPSINAQWQDIEPERGVFQWETIDNALQYFGPDKVQGTLITLDKLLPSWAGPKLGLPRSIDDWRTFVRTVAQRYSDRVKYWQIWNEPGWDKDSESVAKFNVIHFNGHVETDYPPLLKAAYEEIKQINPDAVVIAGALNHDTSGIPENGTYLYEEMVSPAIHIQDYCDAFAIHPYYEPKDWGRFYRDVKEALQRQGVDKELVVTEIGWLHNIPDGAEIQRQALGMTGIAGLIKEGAKKFWIYEDMDDNPAQRYDFDYGLFDYQGNPMPAWNSYKAWVLIFGVLNLF